MVRSYRCLVGLALCAVASPILAQGFAKRSVEIKAGNLNLSAQSDPYTPHVWSNLDLDKRDKPAGWTFMNPAAPTRVTTTIANRWNAINTRWGLPATLADGQRSNKRTGAYWDVFLNTMSDQSLSKFDILLLNASDNLSLSSTERNKLRNYVDQGGILWVDVAPVVANPTDILNPGPVPFKPVVANFAAGIQVALGNPLLSQPNEIDRAELENFFQNGGSYGWLGSGFAPLVGTEGILNATSAFQSTLVNESQRLRAVAGESGTNMRIAFAKQGDGYVVMTTMIANALNQPVGKTGDANRGFYAQPTSYDFDFSVAARVVLNAINLRAGFTGPGGGSRRTSSSAVDTGGPLLKRFQSPTLPGGSESSILYKGRMIVTNAQGVFCFDANPNADLDSGANPAVRIAQPDAPDGNADDGLQDGFTGYDLIWSFNSPGVKSAPVAAEVPASGIRDQILYTQADGSLVILPLSPNDPASPPATVIAPATAPIAYEGLPSAPAVHEDMVYVVDTTTAATANGRIWMADLRTLAPITTANRWQVTGAFRLPETVGAPTIGYIPIQDGSGGMDRVAYVATRRNTGQRRPAGIVSLWIGSRGEKPTLINQNATSIIVTTRAADQQLPLFNPGGNHPLGVKLTFIDTTTGRPLNSTAVNNLVNGPVVVNSTQNGVITVPIDTSLGYRFTDQVGLPANTAIRVDYSLDWGAAAVQKENYVRGELQFVDRLSPIRDIRGNIALAANGNIFVATAPAVGAGTGGSLFCLREEGRGDFMLKYRWELYDQFNFTLNFNGSNNTFTYPASVIDYDRVKEIVPFLNSPLQALRFESGPVVRGDDVYIAATGIKPIFGQNVNSAPFITVLLSFKSNPQVPQITVNNLPGAFTVLQPDLGRSDIPATPTALSAMQPGQFVYETEANSSVGSVKFDSLMTVRRGRMRDALAVNLPLVIRAGGNSDIVMEPELSATSGTFVPGYSNGTFNPMRWYSVFNGFRVISTPVVNGQTLFMGGASVFPNLINGLGPFGTTGLLYGLDTQMSTSVLRQATERPWYRYYSTIERDVAGNIYQGENTLWPYFGGVETMNDFVLRVNQATITDTTVQGLAAGDGTVAAWGNTSMFAFDRADFLVADNGRVMRVDGTGNVLWSLDRTFQGSQTAKAQPLSKPSRVYPSTKTNNWVVDSGNDRIVLLNASGQELRTLNSFKLDPVYRPDGAKANMPTALKQPRDFETYTSVVAAANNPLRAPQAFEFWRHYLVADTGNFRMVEFVDRYAYDPSTNEVGAIIQYPDPESDLPGGIEKAYGVLYWTSRSELTGKRFAYNSISRAERTIGVNRVVTYAFGFGNLEPSLGTFGADGPAVPPASDVESGSGGVVIYDPATGASTVVRGFNMPAIDPNVFYVPAANDFVSPAVPAARREFRGLSSTTLRYDTSGVLNLMVTDATGVYELIPSGADWIANWAMPNEVYRVIRRRNNTTISTDNPLDLRATYARRLDSGDVMIVNGYIGKYRDYLVRPERSFGGEVVFLDGTFDAVGTGTLGFNFAKTNFGFSSFSVKFELPPIQGSRAISSPIFADRR